MSRRVSWYNLWQTEEKQRNRLGLVENAMNCGDLDKYQRVLGFSLGVCWVYGLWGISCGKVPENRWCFISLVLHRCLCLCLTPSYHNTSELYLTPNPALRWLPEPVLPGSLPHHPTPRCVLRPFGTVLQHVTTSQSHLLKQLLSFFPLFLTAFFIFSIIQVT